MCTAALHSTHVARAAGLSSHSLRSACRPDRQGFVFRKDIVDRIEVGEQGLMGMEGVGKGVGLWCVVVRGL